MKTNSLDFDAQALREKILDLAMRGKLVPQDPNDEPASVLLEKIKAEKAELIKEKKIKKSKPLPEITDDEKPFDIPDSWEWVRLGDIAEIVMGQSPKGSTVNNDHNGIEFHQGKTEFKENIIGKSDKFTTSLNKVVNSDYVLMAVRAPVGDVNLLDRKIVIGRGLSGIKPYKSNKNYIFYYLDSMKKYYEQRSTGSTFKAINGDVIKNTPVAFPPLSEQSRIAAKIAQLFALLRKVESSTQQYAELQTLLKSKVLDLAMRGKLVKQDPNDEPASRLLEKIKAEKQELIKEKKIKRSKSLPPIIDEEKPFDIPDSWEWVRLDDVLLQTIGGGTPSKQISKYWNGHIPWISVKDVHENNLKVITTQDKITNEGMENSSTNLIEANTLIVVMRMAVGRIAVIKMDACINQDIRALITSKYFYDKYLLYIYSRLNFNTSGITVKGLKLNELLKTLIPLPPFSEQERIVKQLLLVLEHDY